MAKKAMVLKQQKEQKYSTREYNRCKICGRPHAYLRKFGICRICFRERAYKAQIPGCVQRVLGSLLTASPRLCQWESQAAMSPEWRLGCIHGTCA